MSARNVLNINSMIAVITLAPNVPQVIALGYTPEFVELTNTGANVGYARAVQNGATPAFVTPGSTFVSGAEIQPGASKTYRWSEVVANKSIELVSLAGTTISIKIGTGV